MLVFTGIFLVLLLKMIENKKNAKDNILFLVISFILGFNYLMGTDWQHYQSHYNNLEINNYLNNFFDLGYNTYAILIKSFLGVSYEIFIGTTISICAYVLLKNIKKRTKNYYFGIILYLALFLINTSLEPVIRQLIGITIIVSGLKYIDTKKFFKYLIIVIIAGQFHSALYIALFFYFLDKIEISGFKFILMTIVLFFIVENLESILNIKNSITAILRIEKFSVYLLSERYGARPITLGVIKNFILNGGYIYIIFSSYKKKKNRKNYILNGALIYCLIGIFSYKLQILYRIKDILVFFFIIALSDMDKIKFYKNTTLNNRSRKILTTLFILYQLTIFYRILLGNEFNKFRYGTYRNYFIERIKDDHFYEKKQENESKYIEKIKILLEEDNKKRLMK